MNCINMRVAVLLSCCLALVAGEDAFVKHGVVTDVIDAAPPKELEVVYSPGVKVQGGNELTPTQVKEQPSVSWPTEEGALYTLVMTDPDAPSRENPTRREFLHFLVGNIPANEVSKGSVLFQYVGSGPPKASGLHRYVWLVYKQPGHIDFNQATVTNRSKDNRPGFSIRKFAAEKNLGAPIAGNFFQAQYDDSVPKLHKQLGL